MLVAAMNPCPCGYLGDQRHKCKCSPMQIEKYMGSGSAGPLLDRIDLHVEVPTVPFQDLFREGRRHAGCRDARTGLPCLARDPDDAASPARRRGSTAGCRGRLLREHCAVDEAGKTMLQNAMDKLGLSARAHDRILRMARTIADLDGAANITATHLGEAIGYRNLDRKLWRR